MSFRETSRSTVRRLTTLALGGVVVSAFTAACASDSDSTGARWTYAPVDESASSSPAATGPTPQADASTPPDGVASPGRAEPLQPPAGNVIPRFVEPERADRPIAEEAIPPPPRHRPGRLGLAWRDERAGRLIPKHETSRSSSRLPHPRQGTEVERDGRTTIA